MFPLTDADKAAQVAALRAQLNLDDLVPISVFAAGTGVSRRTIERSIARGELHVVRIANVQHISVSHARERYLASRITATTAG